MAETFERILVIAQQAPLPLLLSFLVTTVIGIALIVSALLLPQPIH